METIFYCAKKTGRQISLVGRSMHRIYNAAKQCGYLKDLIEPVDPRESKNFSRDKINSGKDFMINNELKNITKILFSEDYKSIPKII